MKERIVGVVRGQEPAQSLLRAEYMVMLTPEQPWIARWGRAEVLWTQPDEVLRVRDEGPAILVVGQLAKPKQMREVAESTPDPNLLICFAASSITSGMAKAAKEILQSRRFTLGVGCKPFEPIGHGQTVKCIFAGHTTVTAQEDE